MTSTTTGYRTYAITPAMRRELGSAPLRFVRILDGRRVAVRGRARCRAPRRRVHVSGATSDDPPDAGDPGDRCGVCGAALIWSGGALVCSRRGCPTRATS
jgi:hypothetical protein